ncbi:MAG: hypothetical protein IJ673_01985 [Treponema sp.]|nr:hypothetical protein [Treponema sp.]
MATIPACVADICLKPRQKNSSFKKPFSPKKTRPKIRSGTKLGRFRHRIQKRQARFLPQNPKKHLYKTAHKKTVGLKRPSERQSKMEDFL